MVKYLIPSVNQSAINQSSTAHEGNILHQEDNIPPDAPNHSGRHHAPRLEEI